MKRVLIIGAGAAGLLAAAAAAAAGAEVVVLEKMDRPGRKLSITGKGRCNITNVAGIAEFVAHFGENGRFLRSAFARFFTDDLLRILHSQGVATITERGGRIFPTSGEAQEVVDALVRHACQQGARIECGAQVAGLLIESGRISGVTIGGAAGSSRRSAEAVVVATGGASYPASGSTGDGYQLARQAGHQVIPVRPALVPLETLGKTAAELQGLSLRNVGAAVLVDGKPVASAFGEMLFTHFGLSGPIILTLSREAVDALQARRLVEVSIDLKPALDEQTLDARLRRDFNAHGKQQFQTILKQLLPSLLIPVCISLLGISAEKPAHQITADERRRLLSWLKDFRFQVSGHRAWKAAIITAGGVDLAEIDRRTMQSKLVAGLYFCGEVLDLDADTGGYNLQAAFSTGWVAGNAAAGSGD